MNGKGFIFGIAITLLILLSAAGAYFLGTQNKKTTGESTSSTQNITVPTSQPQPTKAEINESNIPADWNTYKNEEYGFEISYPDNFKALDDAENLYGWPNAVVLIYSGGQSYDLPIEVWDSVSEYETKYPNAGNLTVKMVGSKYITLMNMNFEEKVDEIIGTFKF